MKNVRKAHVGKSQFEKESYRRMVQTHQAEEPTYEDDESISTNSVVIDDKGKSSITEPTLKPYNKEPNIPWRDIIVGLIVVVFTTILFLFGMSLNRDVGILYERTSNISDKLVEVNDEIKNIREKLNDLTIEINSINNTTVK